MTLASHFDKTYKHMSCDDINSNSKYKYLNNIILAKDKNGEIMIIWGRKRINFFLRTF